MDSAAMIDTARRISRHTGKAVSTVLCDMVYCGAKYLAGYVDYETFRLYEMTPEKRKTVITRGVNNRYCRMLNQPSYVKLMDNKVVFNRLFEKQLGRRWIDLRAATEAEFSAFFREIPDAVAKPLEGSCGNGVIPIAYRNSEQASEIYWCLRENRQYLVEEKIRQHTELEALYPDAVNTLRFVTIRKNGRTQIVFACLRIGRGGSVVDNFNRGGLLAAISKEGILHGPAIDKQGNLYCNHPNTFIKIDGFQVPMFSSVCRYVERLAGIVPEIGYTGWDIAITAYGPVVVEGNPFPGHDLYQPRLFQGNGLRPLFESIMNS